MPTATKESKTATVHCKTKLYTIGSWLIARLPEEVSSQLPSRGQLFVEGTINDFKFIKPLEPDGKWSHWLHVDKTLLEGAHVKSGDTVSLELQVIKAWPEPDVPQDLMKAVVVKPQVHDLWQKITPMARWEWVRWTRSTNSADTRKRRIEVAVSKLQKGERRPCCWNRNLCTEPAVSKSGILLDPS